MKQTPPDKFLDRIFPDEIFPVSINAIYKELLIEDSQKGDKVASKGQAGDAKGDRGNAGKKADQRKGGNENLEAVGGSGSNPKGKEKEISTQSESIGDEPKATAVGPKIKSINYKITGQIKRNSPSPWLYEPFGVAAKTRSTKKTTNEDLLSAFINRIAKAVEEVFTNMKIKSTVKKRTSSSIFASTPLKTDANIVRKPDVVGLRPAVLKFALQNSPPALDWRYVYWVMEHKLTEYIGADFKVIAVEVLNKAFAILISSDDRRFAIVPSITGSIVRVSYFDHGGAIHSTEFNMNQEPKLFLHLIVGLMFAPETYLGIDPTLTYLNPQTRILMLRGEKYSVKKTIYRAPMLNGRATKILQCTYKGRVVVVKDAWIYTHRSLTEVYFLLEARAAGVRGIPRILTWEDVMVDGRYDSTDNNRGRFTGLPDRTHRRIVFEGECVPLEQFKDFFELLSIWINIVECKSPDLFLRLDLPVDLKAILT